MALLEWGRVATIAWEAWWMQAAAPALRESLARTRLEQLVEHARRHSPWWRVRLAHLPEQGWALADLPWIDKAGLMAHFDEAVTDPEVTRAAVEAFVADESRAGELFLGRHAVWTSSGTTGEPGLFVADRQALAVYDALEAVRFGLASPGRMAMAATGDRYALVGATGGHFAGNSTVERLRRSQPWMADRVRVISIMSPIEVLLRELDAFSPTWLATYPTAAALLAEHRRAGRLAIRPREIWTGGEQLSPAVRTAVSQAFGCPVRQEYGASEFLPIASECAHGALHVNDDWVLLEPVDERRRPVPAGVRSHTVLLTNLANRVQPLIRYDLGDSVTWLGRCECGSPLPAVQVEGRRDDTLVMLDARGHAHSLLPLALTTVLEDEAGVNRFQLRQDGPSALTLRLAPEHADPRTDARCRQRLQAYLRAQSLPDVRLHVEHGPLALQPVSGKLRRVVARH